MAYVLDEKKITVPAGEDLSADQYKFLVIDQTSGLLRKPTSIGEPSIGVMNNTPSAVPNGNGFYQFQPSVTYAHFTKVRVDAAYPIGTKLMAQYDGTTDHDGRGTIWSGTYDAFFARGEMITATTAENDIAVVRLIN